MGAMSDPSPTTSDDPSRDDDLVDDLYPDDGYDDRDEPGRGRRTWRSIRSTLVLVPLLVVLVGAAAIGATKLWAEVPDRSVAGPEVTCWDGTTAVAADCTEPRGQRGLRWVFPSFRPDDERCARVTSRSRAYRPFDFACEVRFDQRTVTITYAARSSTDQLLSSVRKAYGNRPVTEAEGERIVFRSNRPDADGLYRTTVVYAEHPFAVTVEAPAVDVRDGALAEIVRFRPAAELLVRA